MTSSPPKLPEGHTFLGFDKHENYQLKNKETMVTTKKTATRVLASTLLAAALTSQGSTAIAQASNNDHKHTAVQAVTPIPQATADVWKRHIDAWGKRDLDAIMSDYAEDAVLVLNNQTYEGRPAIRKVFTRLFEIFDQGKNNIDPPTIKDRLVYITWHFTPRAHQTVFGSDTFVVENNAISYQTIASPLYGKYPVPKASQ
ncbi:nuclear transport factor 2 family protein [Streptomyces sioyaensis]|uniref:nuclear transport factor 2 family protein n=1 Tax=Streptomyces sioyaensis TaxID=67364 RepID=UPI0036F04BD6